MHAHKALELGRAHLLTSTNREGFQLTATARAKFIENWLQEISEAMKILDISNKISAFLYTCCLQPLQCKKNLKTLLLHFQRWQNIEQSDRVLPIVLYNHTVGCQFPGYNLLMSSSSLRIISNDFLNSWKTFSCSLVRFVHQNSSKSGAYVSPDTFITFF